MFGMLDAAFYAWHKILIFERLGVREQIFYSHDMRVAERNVASFLTADLARVARIKVILSGISFDHFAVLGHFEAF